MKIALVGAFPPQQKGEAHYLGRYASALRNVSDARIEVISQYTDAPEVTETDGFLVRRAIRDRSKSGTSYAPQAELSDAVIAALPDLMHLHYGPGPDYGGRLGERLCGALRKVQHHGIRTVLTLHSVWLPQDVRDQATRLHAPPALHPLVIAYFGAFMRSLRKSLDAELLLVSAEHSPMTAAFAKAYGVRDLGEEVHACDPRPMPFMANEDPLLFAFGFLRPDKGFDVLIDAFGRYVAEGGRARLKIVGRPQGPQDQEYSDRLVSLANRIPGNRCIVEVRYLPDQELEELLVAADIITVPYLRNVGASGPLHHAIGVGKPVICSDAGHNSALRGVLEVVPAGDIGALQRSIKRTVEDMPFRKSLAERAAAMATNRSWRRLAERNETLYRELCKK